MKKFLFIFISFLSFSFAQVNTNIIHSPFSNLIRQIYQYNGGNYLWLNHPQKLSKVVNALNNGYYNYKNKNFHRNKITQYVYALDSGQLDEYHKQKLDLLITDAYLRLLHFIRIGDVNWHLVQKRIKQKHKKAVWEMHIKKMPNAKLITQYIQSGRINALLQESVGMQQRYKSYIDILQYYRKIPEFRKVPYGKLIKYKGRDKRIYQIKRRLLVLGYFPRTGSINRTFDRDLAYAVKKFRKSFNLPEGYYIDNKLLAYLNLPKSYYINKIITNLDKTKLYPPSFEPTYIEVNVPEFMLRFYQNGMEVFKSNAVVGMVDRPTPLFDDYLEYIVLNPSWNVPQSLIKKDLAPAIKEYPNVFEMAHLKAYQGKKEISPERAKKIILKYEHSKKRVPLQIVQTPGEHNALGRIKFMFPNKYAVYIHDTPEKGLFSHKYRYNSSGCVRIQEPFTLLSYLKPYLKGSYESALDSNKTLYIRLKRKIPVHIIYFTLEFEDDGSPKFMYDAYGYDKIIEESRK